MNRGMNAQTEQSDDWETPPWLFRALDTEFRFTFDAAANETNTKCKKWSDNIGRDHKLAIDVTDIVFCNPPYSDIDLFVDYAFESASVWVLLLPAKIDNGWFARLIHSPRCELRWFRKRIQFWENGVEMKSPRFTSVIAIVRPSR